MRFRFLLLAGVMLVAAVPARAELRPYGGRYMQPDEWFSGAGYRLGLPLISVIPNAEYVFTTGHTYISLNADVTIGLFIIGYVGGGIGINYLRPDGGDTGTLGAVNLIGGVEFAAVPLSPFLQAKYAIIAKADNTFVLSLGFHL
jgi:hypothetical protein